MSESVKPAKLIRDPGHFLSLGLGSGLIPFAPGTFGTLAAIPLYYFAYSYLSPVWYLCITLCAAVVGIYLCGRTTRALGVQDHPAIVWDEIVGYFITMLFIPFSILNIVLGFVLFRIFDILKPWPVSVIDSRIKGGIGVMLDDVVAAIYALILLHIVVRIYS